MFVVRDNAFNFARARPGAAGTSRVRENVSVDRAAAPVNEHGDHTYGSARWSSMFHDRSKRIGAITMSIVLETAVAWEPLTSDTSFRTVSPRLSPAQLQAWLQCPLSHHLRYVQGSVPRPSLSGFLGTVVRSALVYLHQAERERVFPDVDDLDRYVLGNWQAWVERDGMKFSSVPEERALQRQACVLLAAYLDQRAPDEPPSLAVAQRIAVPVIDAETGEDLGVDLVGELDLVLDGPTGPVIVDFRTSSRSASPMEVLQEVHLNCQAYLYRHIAGCAEGGLETRRLVKTKTPQVQYQRWPARADLHLRRLLAVIRSYLAAGQAGHVIYRPSLACSWCAYRDTACRTWLAS